MKCKVIEISHQAGTFKCKLEGLSEEPNAGSIYILEEFKQHSSKQRKLFEPLVRVYFNSFCFPTNWPVETWEDLRDQIKMRLGQGVDLYEFVDDKLSIQRVHTLGEIPDYVIEDYNKGNRNRIRIYNLISTKKYNIKQFYEMTDSLIRQMIHGGVGKSKVSKKFNSILDQIGITQ
jgi:hypothetical protein